MNLYFILLQCVAVGTTLQDIALMIGMTPDTERNLEDMFVAVLQNDMRPLLKMGMPKGEWYDTMNMLTQIVDGGLEVWGPTRYQEKNFIWK